MITFAQFTEIVEQLAPLKYAYEWDNSGVQAHVHDEVSKVLVCLDMTKDTLREAKEKGCDTILAHHPVLFRQVKNLEKNHVVTGLIVDAVLGAYLLRLRSGRHKRSSCGKAGACGY